MSFDLIYARPDQTVEEWEKELKEAISYAVDHLSLYQLTIEEGTPFYGLHKVKQADRTGRRAIGAALRGDAGDHRARGHA